MPTFLTRVKRVVFGAPVATDSTRPVVLRTRLALAVFGVGLLSTVAYAPDAVLDALRRGGQADAMPWIASGVVAVMLVLGFAYRSNVRHRPDERGDYALVRERLGATAGLVTGAALLVDYLFTVAVSVAAVAKFTGYVVPHWESIDVWIAVGVIAVMMLLALRGTRPRARVLVVVWFGFAAVVAGLAIFGVAADATAPAATPVDASGWIVAMAFAGAIASGSVMMTGIEHLAASGPAHAAPSGVRAGRTLLIATFTGAAAFFAVSWLVWDFGIEGWRSGPAIMQVTDAIFGSPAATLVVALACVAVLYGAASSIFRRFVGLSSLLASDSYLPRQFAMRNDRLVFRGGVLAIAIASAVVVLVSRANLLQLIHMYVIGVFASIVLSQFAMVRLLGAKAALETEPGALRRLRGEKLLHVVATVVAAAVWIVIAVFNFVNGAWIAIALVAVLAIGMRGIQAHYVSVRKELRLAEHDPSAALPSATHGVVLVAQLHRPAMRALAYAKAVRHTSLTALGVKVEAHAARELQHRWTEMDIGVPLVILDSPYRDIVGPVMDYVKSIHRESPRDVVVMYVPEYIVGHWWERMLHNRSTTRLRELLLRTPGVVVAAVPWLLDSAADRVLSPDRLTDVE